MQCIDPKRSRLCGVMFLLPSGSLLESKTYKATLSFWLVIFDTKSSLPMYKSLKMLFSSQVACLVLIDDAT